MGTMQAIKVFFEKDGGRPVTMDELKSLSKEDRIELATLACKAMGVGYKPA